MRKSIAQHMRDVLLENGMPAVAYGDAFLLDECGARAGMSGMHPLDRHAAILNALDRSRAEMFEKYLFRGHIVDRNGVTRQRALRAFRLNE